jgi:hypothetical protein
MLLKRIFIGLLALTWFSAAPAADDIVLKEQHPTEYTIVRGDTLWDIASRFLRDPWRWPDIWYVNPQIENPHLIYPGDQVVLTYKDGRPQLELRRATGKKGLRVVKLSPTVRREQISAAIPTIPIDAIRQFLSRPTVMEKKELEAAPYIVSSQGEHLISGTGDRVYARGIEDNAITRYTIVRQGEVYRDTPENKGRVLGYEALYVGEAVVKRFGATATLDVTDSVREILVGDRLIPTEVRPLEFSFLPRAPDDQVDGNIISVVDGVSRIGQFQVVVLNKGTADGLDKGHVLAIHQRGMLVRDTVSSERGKLIMLPSERAGYLMVFRPYEKVSYALIMRSERAIRLYDSVKNP